MDHNSPPNIGTDCNIGSLAKTQYINNTHMPDKQQIGIHGTAHPPWYSNRHILANEFDYTIIFEHEYGLLQDFDAFAFIHGIMFNLFNEKILHFILMVPWLCLVIISNFSNSEVQPV